MTANKEKQQGLKFGDRTPAAQSDIAFKATPQITNGKDRR